VGVKGVEMIDDVLAEAVEKIDQYLKYYDYIYLGELRERIIKLRDDMKALQKEIHEAPYLPHK
jgi:hypothetical protein